MASIITKKKTIVRKPIISLCTGLILILAGYITFNYLNLIKSAIINFFKGISSALKDFFSPLSQVNISFNASTIISFILFAISLWFIVKGIRNIIHNFKESDVIRLLLKLPNDYYILNDIIINKNLIDHVVICPKGIFTIDTKNWKDSTQKNQKYSKQYNMIKQGILNSKLINDFLQKNDVGNYFVNTIIVSANWDEKLKEHFSEIHVLQPEQLTQHIGSLQDKYSPEECVKIADSLKNTLFTEPKKTEEKSINKDTSKEKASQNS